MIYISKKGVRFTLSFAIITSLYLAPLLSAGGDLTLIGSALLTEIEDIDYHGNRVLGALTSGLILIDFSDPTYPAMIDYLSTHEPCTDVLLTDSIAFAACGSQGVLMVGSNDTLAIEPVSTIPTEGSAVGLFMEWPYLFVATSNYGLEIFDVSDPAGPYSISKLQLSGNPSEVWVQDTTALVSDISMKLWIVSVADIENPYILGLTQTRGLAKDVSATDNIAIVADFSIGITSFDVSNPAAILMKDFYNTSGKAYDLYLDYPRLYLADDFGGAHLFSVSENGMLDRIDWRPPEKHLEDVRGIAARGDTAVMGEDLTGVYMVDWTDATFDTIPPPLIGLYEVPGYVQGAQSLGNRFVAVAAGHEGLRIIRMKENGRADYVSVHDLDGLARDVEVKDTLAFVAKFDKGLSIVSIADFDSPVLLSNVPDSGRFVMELRAFGNYLYLVDGDFKVLDFADPTEPAFIESLETPTFSNDMFLVSPERIFVAEAESGLIVISSPSGEQPEIVGRKVTGGYVQGVYVQNEEAFVADDDSGLAILDVSDLSDINWISATDVGGVPLDVVVSGDIAYMALEEGAVVEVDVSDRFNPRLTDRYETPDRTLNLDLSSDTLIAADYTSLLLFRTQGLGIGKEDGLRGDRAPAAFLHQNYPNPFNPHTTILVDRAGMSGFVGKLRIYDIRGRLMRTIHLPSEGSIARITWDGKDSRGRDVPSGIYFYRVEGLLDTRKMLLLR